MSMSKADLVSLLVEVRPSLPDALALKYTAMYPHWAAGITITQDMIDKGQNRFQHGGLLYRAIQPHTTQADWTPDITASLFEVIDVEHAGTAEDPIPWAVNMQCYNGKYYKFDNVLYLCIRDSGIALAYTPDQLVGNYFELA